MKYLKRPNVREGQIAIVQDAVNPIRSAVRRSHLYDPDVNQTFVEFANHWGFAVILARPYRPKAAVEAGVGLIQRQFFNEVRDRTFYSLSELKQTYREFKKRLNTSPMKDHGDLSRSDRFLNEKPHLKPLPSDHLGWDPSSSHPK